MKPLRLPRFNRTQRLIHWSYALTFFVLGATGGVLLLRSMTKQWAPISTFSWVHKGAGIVFSVLPLLIALLGNRRSVWADIKTIARLDADDRRWLLVMPQRFFGRKVDLPPVGRFNAGQKLNAWLVVTWAVGFTVSGVAIWLNKGALLFYLIHVGLAILIIPPLSVHIYMALINRHTRHALRAMVFGNVNAGWAKEHYPKWYNEVVPSFLREVRSHRERDAAPRPSGREPSPPERAHTEPTHADAKTPRPAHARPPEPMDEG